METISAHIREVGWLVRWFIIIISSSNINIIHDGCEISISIPVTASTYISYLLQLFIAHTRRYLRLLYCFSYRGMHIAISIYFFFFFFFCHCTSTPNDLHLRILVTSNGIVIGD